MKRILCLILTLVLCLFCFAACGDKETTKTEKPLPQLEGTVTVEGEGMEDTDLLATTDVENPQYQWYCDGTPIANAIYPQLRVPVNAAGKAITVAVRAEGYDGEITSDPITATANAEAYRSMIGVYYASKISGRVFIDPDQQTAARIEWPACGFEFKVNAVGGAMKVYHQVCGQDVETEIPIIKTKEGLFDLKIRTFLDACKNGTPAPVPSSQTLYNQAIIDGIAKSAEAGKEVEIVIPEI